MLTVELYLTDGLLRQKGIAIASEHSDLRERMKHTSKFRPLTLRLGGCVTFRLEDTNLIRVGDGNATDFDALYALLEQRPNVRLTLPAEVIAG